VIREHDDEPVRGLPAALPPGERILWQGAPDWRILARHAFHVRLVAAYFGVLIAGGVATGAYRGAAITLALGVAGVALLHLLAWLSARATVYTITNRRIVLRIGIALPMCINLPLPSVAAARLALHANGSGDIALALLERQRVGYALLWPHARAWRLSSPEPSLRALADAQTVATLVARVLASTVPGGQRVMPTSGDFAVAA
jgi:hypothetical protein